MLVLSDKELILLLKLKKMTEEKKEKIKIVPPHKLISRDVTPADVDQVYKDAKDMYDLIGEKIGNYAGFYAIAHCQITEKDPLRFFLINPQHAIFDEFPEAVIINPVIIRHTKHTVEKEEGCLSYATLPTTMVERWHKCEVEFHVLNENKMISEKFTKNLSGTLAQVFQHEINHFDSVYIYDIMST